MINEIWEGLRLLPFFSSPKRGFYDGKRGLRILATRRPTPGHTMAPASAVSPRRPCRQAGPHGPPRRPGPGLSPLGVSLAAALWPSSGPKGMRAALQSSGWPPATPRRASAAGGLVVAGAGGVRPGPSRAAVVSAGRLRRPPENRGRQPPAQVVGIKGPGLRGTAGRPPCGLWPFPRGGGLFSWPSGRPWGVAASPGPSPARPRLWSILGGAPQSPAARVGPAVRNGCVPWRRQAPVFSIAPGPQRGAGT